MVLARQRVRVMSPDELYFAHVCNLVCCFILFLFFFSPNQTLKSFKANKSLTIETHPICQTMIVIFCLLQIAWGNSWNFSLKMKIKSAVSVRCRQMILYTTESISSTGCHDEINQMWVFLGFLGVLLKLISRSSWTLSANWKKRKTTAGNELELDMLHDSHLFYCCVSLHLLL